MGFLRLLVNVPRRLSAMTGQALSATPSSSLPELGVFQKTLNAMLNSPAEYFKDNSLVFGVTERDIGSNCNSRLRSVLSLDQSTPKELARVVRREVVRMFARRPNDTGSAEVQIALSTVRLAIMRRHIEQDGHLHDYKTKRAAVKELHDRKKMLKYLKRVSLERFYIMLDRLGLPPDYLDGFEYPYQYHFKKTRGFRVPANRSIRGGGRFIQDATGNSREN